MTREKLLSRRQRGAVAILVSVALLSLIAMLGLVVDMSHLYIAKTELTNAADACSLAAASQLTGVNVGPSPNQLDLAESAGITVGQHNKVGFQGTNVLIPANSAVTFSDHLNGIYNVKTAITGANVAAMKYARCVLPIADTISTGIIPYFMQVLGPGAQAASAQAVGGQAVATLASGITNCGIPVGMCKVTPAPATCPHGQTVDAYGLCTGEWYCSKFTTGGSTTCSGAGLTGNFNIVDYGLSPNGANVLKALLTGTGQCALTPGVQTGRTGAVQSLSDAWNTRFGINKGGTSGTPDFTGYSYTATYNPGYTGGNWPSAYNAYSGTTAGVDNFQTSRSKNTPYQGDYNPPSNPNLGGIPGPPGTNGSTYLTQNQLASTGADRRIAVVPIVDCSAWAGGGNQKAPILAFACILMLDPWATPGDPLYLEYEGLSNLATSPCATAGLPGGPASVGPKVPSLVR